MGHGNEFNAFSAHKSMYLIVIAWTYVTLMMAVAEATHAQGSVLGAIVTFVLYGLLPVALLMYILGTPARRRAHRARQTTAGASAEPVATALPNSQDAGASRETHEAGPGSPPPGAG